MGANAAFTATNGGIVNVCANNPCGGATAVVNTLATTTGTALNVANTTIGPSGLTFRSISAGTAASGPASGIILTSTGASGGLTVTGSGTANSGGTIQRTTSHGIVVNGTSNLVLERMLISNAERTAFTPTTSTTSPSATAPSPGSATAPRFPPARAKMESISST